MEVVWGSYRTATKVPGRKNMVSTAIAFMADASRLLSLAISRESLLPRVAVPTSSLVGE